MVEGLEVPGSHVLVHWGDVILVNSKHVNLGFIKFFQGDQLNRDGKFIIEVPCNRISCPSNRSKQIKETCSAYWMKNSIHVHGLLHRQQVIVCEAMYVYAVFHSNFAAYIVCLRYHGYKSCGCLGFVWTNCWGN